MTGDNSTPESDGDAVNSVRGSSRYQHVRIHLCESCGDGFQAGDEVVSLSDGYVDENEDYDVSNRRFWHRDCFSPGVLGS